MAHRPSLAQDAAGPSRARTITEYFTCSNVFHDERQLPNAYARRCDRRSRHRSRAVLVDYPFEGPPTQPNGSTALRSSERDRLGIGSEKRDEAVQAVVRCPRSPSTPSCLGSPAVAVRRRRACLVLHVRSRAAIATAMARITFCSSAAIATAMACARADLDARHREDAKPGRARPRQAGSHYRGFVGEACSAGSSGELRHHDDG